MLLTEKEMSVLKDLQTQEKNCIDKYEKYAGLAKDDELKQLFEELKKKEQEHYKTIGQILNGEVPSCDCNDTAGKDYQPKGGYSKSEESEDKKNDCFLATDSIGTEKLVSCLLYTSPSPRDS